MSELGGSALRLGDEVVEVAEMAGRLEVRPGGKLSWKRSRSGADRVLVGAWRRDGSGRREDAAVGLLEAARVGLGSGSVPILWYGGADAS